MDIVLTVQQYLGTPSALQTLANQLVAYTHTYTLGFCLTGSFLELVKLGYQKYKLLVSVLAVILQAYNIYSQRHQCCNLTVFLATKLFSFQETDRPMDLLHTSHAHTGRQLFLWRIIGLISCGTMTLLHPNCTGYHQHYSMTCFTYYCNNTS